MVLVGGSMSSTFAVGTSCEGDVSAFSSDLLELSEDRVEVLPLIPAYPADVDRQGDVGSQQDEGHEAADDLHRESVRGSHPVRPERRGGGRRSGQVRRSWRTGLSSGGGAPTCGS